MPATGRPTGMATCITDLKIVENLLNMVMQDYDAEFCVLLKSNEKIILLLISYV